MRILIVEDDTPLREACVAIFETESDHAAEAVSSGEEALGLLDAGRTFDAVVTDLKLPGMDGIDLLTRLKRRRPATEVVLMTGYGTIRSAVDAIRKGAADYLTKPFEIVELVAVVEKLQRVSRLEDEVRRLQGMLSQHRELEQIVGSSAGMRAVLEWIVAASRSQSTTLITGETGTGKELVARAIHYGGERSPGPFIAVNCGAIPADLLESELFGHRAGAFTGAIRDAIGLVRSAEGGTILLDEIAELPQQAQVKLLRFLQQRVARPVGGTEAIPVDVRVIASTNRDPEEALAAGTLRSDLYYRLSVLPIRIPPLRQRREDIPLLVRHFLVRFNRRADRRIDRLDPTAMDILTRHAWPGNVRELENVIEGLFALGISGTVVAGDLPARLIGSDPSTDSRVGGSRTLPTLRDAERELLVRALRISRTNKAEAARMLGISRQRLYRMAREYGLRD